MWVLSLSLDLKNVIYKGKEKKILKLKSVLSALFIGELSVIWTKQVGGGQTEICLERQ